jgi:hypothetical protein
MPILPFFCPEEEGSMTNYPQLEGNCMFKIFCPANLPTLSHIISATSSDYFPNEYKPTGLCKGKQLRIFC